MGSGVGAVVGLSGGAEAGGVPTTGSTDESDRGVVDVAAPPEAPGAEGVAAGALAEGVAAAGAGMDWLDGDWAGAAALCREAAALSSSRVSEMTRPRSFFPKLAKGSFARTVPVDTTAPVASTDSTVPTVPPWESNTAAPALTSADVAAVIGPGWGMACPFAPAPGLVVGGWVALGRAMFGGDVAGGALDGGVGGSALSDASSAIWSGASMGWGAVSSVGAMVSSIASAGFVVGGVLDSAGGSVSVDSCGDCAGAADASAKAEAAAKILIFKDINHLHD